MKKEKILDALIESNCITSYKFYNVSENGQKDVCSAFRNSETVELTFPNGICLKIDSFCSGINEDVTLHFEKI